MDQPRFRFFRELVVIAALVLSFMAACGDATRAEEGAGGIAPGSPKLSLDVTLCGFVEVPQSHAEPMGATISIPVVRLLAVAPGPSPKAPVFFFDGGPGFASIDSSVGGLLLRLFRLFGPDRDLIVFDQRGLGYGRPSLKCSPQPQEPDLDVQSAWAKICATKLENDGIGIEDHNNVSTAFDIDVIRRALGYERIIPYGSSHGSLLARHFARAFLAVQAEVDLDDDQSGWLGDAWRQGVEGRRRMDGAQRFFV